MTRCQNRFQEVIKRRLTRQRNVKRIMTLQRLISRFHHHPNLIKIRSLLKPFILTRWMVVVITPNEQFSSYIKARTSYTRWAMRWLWCPLCTWPIKTLSCQFYSARSLKWQSTGSNVAPLGHVHIILTPSQSVFVLTPYNAECLTEKQLIPFS
jgi:hypothetical protein